MAGVFTQGSKVYVRGRLRTRKWQDQNGQDRYMTEIQGDVLQMLDSCPERNQDKLRKDAICNEDVT